MFKSSTVTCSADQLFPLNYGCTAVAMSLSHLLCNHCFRKLKNPVVREPLARINETQICFSMSSCGSVTYYKNVFDEIRSVYFHVVKINLVVLWPWSEVLMQTKPSHWSIASCSFLLPSASPALFLCLDSSCAGLLTELLMASPGKEGPIFNF